MKNCHKCHTDKDEKEFSKDSSRKDGLRDICKKCDYEKRHAYREAHPQDKINSNIQGKIWAAKNPEKVKMTSKNWRINNKDHIKKTSKIWENNNKERVAAQQKKDHLKAFYGLSLDQFNQMFINQNNKCAICEIEFDQSIYQYHIDHDHATGEVRGLLCQQCNLGLGRFYDDVNNFERAIDYINFHSNIGDQS